MTTPTTEELRAEFSELLNDLAGANCHARLGLHLQKERIENLIEQRGFGSNRQVLMGRGDPNAEGAMAYQSWAMASIPDRLANDGLVSVFLGQQWIVSVYAYWEDHYRQLFADAAGVEKNDIEVPLFGDFRLMRHDIVHHRGIASAKNSGCCTLLKWFEVGDTMLVTDEHIEDFMKRTGIAFLLEPGSS